MISGIYRGVCGLFRFAIHGGKKALRQPYKRNDETASGVASIVEGPRLDYD